MGVKRPALQGLDNLETQPMELTDLHVAEAAAVTAVIEEEGLWDII